LKYIRIYYTLSLIHNVVIVLVDELTEKEGGTSVETNADNYFEPFQLACESRHPRLMDVSLDAIHYLMGMYERLSNML
jgi:hypothetical protein